MKIRDLVPWKEREAVPVRLEEGHPFYGLQREINRMFDEFGHGFELPTLWRGERMFTPQVDVVETDTTIQVTAELPGMKQEDIELTLVHDILTIKGEKKEEKEEKKRDYYRIERKYGSFSRSIPLPSDVVDNEKVEAAFADGVLTITLPKLPEAQAVSKQIPIKAG